jgi:hypothetical protein
MRTATVGREQSYQPRKTGGRAAVPDEFRLIGCALEGLNKL